MPPRWMLFLLSAAPTLGAAGCFESPEDLAPFPCPGDGVCSDDGSLVCVGRGGASGFSPVCIPPSATPQYTPFDCAADGSCAVDGYTCVPGTGCVSTGDVASYTPFRCSPKSTCPLDSLVCIPQLGCLVKDECDVSKQNCPSGTRPKCTRVLDGAGASYSECLAETGRGQLGQSCTRAAPGMDDCAKGLYCNSGFSPDGALACRRFCHASKDCGVGVVCVHPFGSTSDGICVPSCRLGDDTCSADRTCRQVDVDPGTKDDLFACTMDGNRGEWAACDASNDCAHGLECYVGVCWRLCGGALTCQDDPCYQLSPSHSACSNPKNGICQCSCDLFGPCPDGTSCSPLDPVVDNTASLCRPRGPGKAGDPCDQQEWECGPNLVCFGNTTDGYFCLPICDGGHPCPQGLCTPLPGRNDGGGICEGECVPWTVPCGEDHFCPQGSTCDGGNSCDCPKGGVYCNGTPCGPGGCVGPGYMCK